MAILDFRLGILEGSILDWGFWILEDCFSYKGFNFGQFNFGLGILDFGGLFQL
jgi:hypothetical protein